MQVKKCNVSFFINYFSFNVYPLRTTSEHAPFARLLLYVTEHFIPCETAYF